MSPRKRKTYRNIPDRPHGKARVADLRTLKATVDKNRRGFGFLIFADDKVEDVFIPPREAGSLFHGDRVEVVLSKSNEVIQLKVLEHRFHQLVGRYTPAPRKGHGPKAGWVVYERKRTREEVYIPGGCENANAGDWVRASLQFHEAGTYLVTGKIAEVYGPELPASADIPMLAAEFNLTEEHTSAAEAEVEKIEADFNPKGRTDLRHIPFITIDGETARDFDDAIYVEHNKSGHTLWVAIADVSHYVRESGAIDKDAYGRGTSVYFAERAFHMLPRKLSEGLCSLKPNEPRLAFVAKMEYDYRGLKTETTLIEAIIQSHRRATYTEIEAEYKQHHKDKKWRYAPHFELYRRLRKLRIQRGTIDFDLPEAEVVSKPTGEPISITQRARFDSHRLIEDFMIAANEAVTEWIVSRGWPFIFRVHDEPATASLLKFQKLAKGFGVGLSLEGNIHEALSELVRRVEGHPAQAVLNMALLRSMKQAIYSAEHGKHFGLASKAYTHFTSPIRRYPDLMVHRLLRLALHTEQRRLQPLGKKERQRLSHFLSEAAEHCSYRERLAADAERQSIRLKQVRLMRERLGDEFPAKVIGMSDAGLFVQIDDPYVEGLIKQESMTDDFYQFNEDRMAFVGSRSKKTFRIGDPVKVRTVRADLDERQIDFALIPSS